ncbi:MAG: DUF2080 family transposase-associated protein [Pseudomonadota bacterium]
MPAVRDIDAITNPAPEKETLAQTHPTKFTIWGSEAKQKQVTLSGKSGRIYLPFSCVGKTVIVVSFE